MRNSVSTTTEGRLQDAGDRLDLAELVRVATGDGAPMQHAVESYKQATGSAACALHHQMVHVPLKLTLDELTALRIKRDALAAHRKAIYEKPESERTQREMIEADAAAEFSRAKYNVARISYQPRTHSKRANKRRAAADTFAKMCE